MLVKEKIPSGGYILPLWEQSHAYRATAHAYMKREKIYFVENVNGETYNLTQIENAMIKPGN